MEIYWDFWKTLRRRGFWIEFVRMSLLWMPSALAMYFGWKVWLIVTAILYSLPLVFTVLIVEFALRPMDRKLKAAQQKLADVKAGKVPKEELERIVAGK